MHSLRWLLLAGLLATAGCSPPHQLLRVTPPDGPIAGIATALGKRGSVDVVFVHGMCHHEKEWAERRNTMLAEELGLTRTGLEEEPLGASKGRLLKDVLKDASREVRTYALWWSPITSEIKRSLCYDVSEATSVCQPELPDTRVRFNAVLKNVVFDECFADAVYYAGSEGGRVIRTALESGLASALSGGRIGAQSSSADLRPLQEHDTALFIVTESLGSKMTLDALIQMAGRDCDSVKHAVSRIAQMSMWANQVPLLALAYNPETPCGSDVAAGFGSATGLGALGRLYAGGRAASKQMPTLQVAAFSDPNDILSWTLYPVRDEVAHVSVVDVVTSNAWGYFGLFEHPYDAHTTYDLNRWVLRALVCGRSGLAGPCPKSGTPRE